MKTILERYAKQIRGVIRCFDRVLLQGSLPGVGFPSGMQGFLTRQGTRVFDFAEFSKPLTEQLRAIARTLADDHGLKIEHANRRTFDKEAYVAKVPAERGDHPGLVSIISAMEVCSTYEARIDPKTKKPVLRRDNGKLHSLLLLFHRSRPRPLPPARQHLGAVSPPVLFQRPQLASSPARSERHRVQAGR